MIRVVSFFRYIGTYSMTASVFLDQPLYRESLHTLSSSGCIQSSKTLKIKFIVFKKNKRIGRVIKCIEISCFRVITYYHFQCNILMLGSFFHFE